MDGRFFISYSRGDAAGFAGQLADRLVAGPPSYPVWLDVRDEQPGLDWDNQIRDAIQVGPGLLFVMTRDSVQDHSACKPEWVWALKYKKPVIPLRVDADAELPFRLSSRQYIDFSAGFEAGLERERQPERPSAAPARAKFVNTPPVVAPGYFQDRHVESELVGDFLRADDARMMTVVGRGGVGKTAMVCRLLKALEGGHLPDDLGELAADGIVYLSPAGAHPVNFPNLFADLCRLLPPETADRLLQRYRDPHETPAALMRALLDAVPSGRVVVLLDNAEDVIDARTGEFGITDAALDEALRTLLSAPAHGVKVILTTRVAPRELLLVRPERQRRLGLDEGLDSPYAEQVLRARDPAGRLGLKTAPGELLDQARRRTRGYPRALEALTAILAADRNTTLAELLAETGELPGNVVEILVGEAFSRLDASAQQVMQALAIYKVPVPPVAVDYLLQPYRPAVDAAPVLSRLVNMQFVRREAGRYHLHQVDRDYALSRVPAGEPADRDADPAPFTRQALRHRGADYFEQTRMPRENWKTLDDLAPQLAEFELRYQGHDYDTAAQVLLDIGFDYLIRWGHYRLTVEMYQKLQGHLHDPQTDANSKYDLGSCYRALGEFIRAIDFFEQVLAITRKAGDRLNQAVSLGNLGHCYYELGQIRRAIESYELALAINREGGYRQNEADNLVALGHCYYELGQMPQALSLYEQALAIQRQIGYRHGEALGLVGLAAVYENLEAWGRAAEYRQQAIDVADAISSAQAQSGARQHLASTCLFAGDLPAAQQAAIAARGRDYPPDRAGLSLLLGIAQLRQDHPAEAAREFAGALTQADELLQEASGTYAALDTRALALCGLALTTNPDRAAEAAAAFRAARAITSADGIVRATLALFDALAAADRDDILAGIRPEAAGRDGDR